MLKSDLSWYKNSNPYKLGIVLPLLSRSLLLMVWFEACLHSSSKVIFLKFPTASYSIPGKTLAAMLQKNTASQGYGALLCDNPANLAITLQTL